MAKQLLQLSDLSTEELAHLGEEVEATLTTVFKINTRRASLSLERRMADAVSRAWKKKAKNALTVSLKQLLKVTKKKFSAKAIKAFLARIGLALKAPLTVAQVDILGKRLESIYKIGKKLAAKEAKFSFGFRAKDLRAIKAINKQQVFWIGDFYSTHLSERIAAVTDEILLQRGLGPKEAGKELHNALSREFGITKGGRSKTALQVPSRYAGNPEHYFRQVAGTVAHRARTFGKITAFSEAGITRYRLLNPMDSKTGRVCFGAGALVLLANGSQVPIENVKAGMLVITAKGKIRPIQEILTRITHDWYTCCSFGGSFTITPDHEILTANGWKAVSDLHGRKEKIKVFDVQAGISSVPVKIATSESEQQSSKVLQSQVLPRSSKATTLDDREVSPLRGTIRSKEERGSSGEAEALLYNVQQACGKEGHTAKSVEAPLSKVRKAIQAKTAGSPNKEESSLLFQGMQSRPRYYVRDLREEDQAGFEALLFSSLLPKKQIANNARNDHERNPEETGDSFCGRSASRTLRNRLCNSGEHCIRDRRGLLASNFPDKAGSLNSESRLNGNTDQRKRVNERSNACCNEVCDLSPTWYGKEDTESNLAWGYADICISDPFFHTATSYNLGIKGDDPSYVVAGVAVHNCQVMHNQEFEVSTGVSHMNKILGATSPKQIKTIDPWLSGEETEDVVGTAKPGSKAATDALTDANQILPPFHPLCVAFGCLVTTDRGLVPIEQVKVGDFVLTHRGRFRRVTEIMFRRYSGLLTSFVALSDIGLTKEHPILETSDVCKADSEDSDNFIIASKLTARSRIQTLKKAMRGMPEIYVSGTVAQACEVLLEVLPIDSAKQRNFRDEAASYFRSSMVDLQTLWQVFYNAPKPNEVFLRQRLLLLPILQAFGHENRIRENLQDMREAVSCNSVYFEAAKLFPCVQERLSTHRKKEAAVFCEQHEGFTESYVWEGTEGTHSSSNKIQRNVVCSRKVRNPSDHRNREDGLSLSVRTKTLQVKPGYDIRTRFLYPEIGSLDRDRRGLQEIEEAEVRSFCKDSSAFLDSPESPSMLFEPTNPKSLSRFPVVDIPVFNLEVEEDHTFIVGGVVVHNCRTEPIVVFKR